MYELFDFYNGLDSQSPEKVRCHKEMLKQVQYDGGVKKSGERRFYFIFISTSSPQS
jgi:hypothetical protein